MNRSAVLVVLLLAVITTGSIAAYGDPVVLATTESPGFSPRTSSTGPAGKVVQCVFAGMGSNLDVRFTHKPPTANTLQDNSLDGFFPAMKSAELEHSGVLSPPVLLEKWYWVGIDPDLLYSEAFPRDARIGAIRGSAKFTWLESTGHVVSRVASSEQELQQLLQARQIDTFLSEKPNSETNGRRHGQEQRYRFARYTPFGVFFSTEFLAHSSNFIGRFAQELSHCQPTLAQLTRDERVRLRELVEGRIAPWASNEDIIRTLLESNRENEGHSVKQILALDQSWRAELATGHLDFVQKLYDAPLSNFLRTVKQRQEGLVTEIILMDARGANVAISDITTDYWQGDEPKYLQAALLNDDIYFSEISYDVSTRRFQVEAAIPIRQQGTLIGIISFGIDVESALQT